VDSELSPQEGQDTGLSPTEPGVTPAGGYPGAAGDAYPGSAGRPTGPGYYPPAPPAVGSAPPYPYNPPYPYPGQTPPGSPGGPGGAPDVPWPAAAPARPARRRGLLLALTAAVAVVVGAAATGVVLLLGKSESPTTMALQSGQAIALAKGLTLTGTIAGQSASLAVTKAGTVEGSYSQSGNPVTRITINDMTYIKAPTAFWRSVVINPLAAQQAGGNWAKALGGAIIMTFDSLTPGQVAHVLEHVGNNPRVVDTTPGGTKVIKLTAHGTSYYITTSIPNRLVRIVGRSGARPIPSASRRSPRSPSARSSRSCTVTSRACRALSTRRPASIRSRRSASTPTATAGRRARSAAGCRSMIPLPRRCCSR
jgi:hypothetical protein